jgi:hypothetical protein
MHFWKRFLLLTSLLVHLILVLIHLVSKGKVSMEKVLREGVSLTCRRDCPINIWSAIAGRVKRVLHSHLGVGSILNRFGRRDINARSEEFAVRSRVATVLRILATGFVTWLRAEKDLRLGLLLRLY